VTVIVQEISKSAIQRRLTKIKPYVPEESIVSALTQFIYSYN